MMCRINCSILNKYIVKKRNSIYFSFLLLMVFLYSNIIITKNKIKACIVELQYMHIDIRKYH